jgi:argininosuccinate lyase
MTTANLWDKGGTLDPRVRAFTVGDDWLLDRALLPWDIAGSAAHARMLGRIGVLDASEVAALVAELRSMHEAARAGEFTVTEADEDGHTAIEARLTARLGALGRKVHLGRSRNDQVALALRLLARDAALDLSARLGMFAEAMFAFVDRHGDVALPGHTHLQAAMPSTFALWGQAWIEAALESMRALAHLHGELNRCPLGAAAGFGSPVPLDRGAVALALGFSAPQRSVVDVIHSRARLEGRLLHEIAVVGATLEKFACDLSLYLTREFGYLRMDPAFRTGSSIMPQKQNPDVVELLRARVARLRARHEEHTWVSAKLPSNYHRDQQLLKAPLLRGIDEAREALDMATLLPAHLFPQEPILLAAMTTDLDAAREASERALEGVPFRDAYRETAAAAPAPGQSRGVPPHVADDARSELSQSRGECTRLRAWTLETRLTLAARLEEALGPMPLP